MRKEEKDKKIRPDLRGRQIVPKIKARPHRRTCADGGDTDREIYPKIVCEAKGRVRDFGVNFVEGAAELSAACGGCSEAEQGPRSQSASAAARRDVRCGHRNPLSKGGNRSLRQRRGRLLPS